MTDRQKLTALEVQVMLGVEDLADIAYGYTFDRKTVCVYFHQGRLIREEKKGDRDNPVRFDSEYFEPDFFRTEIKRFYRDRTHPHLLVLFNTFGFDLPLTG